LPLGRRGWRPAAVPLPRRPRVLRLQPRDGAVGRGGGGAVERAERARGADRAEAPPRRALADARKLRDRVPLRAAGGRRRRARHAPAPGPGGDRRRGRARSRGGPERARAVIALAPDVAFEELLEYIKDNRGFD